ncbi:MAG: helix-turn-helix domain-containing protein [Pseudomonadota bacterium]|nr:helix-turn-helix domain-containing protein [Pseudomonadota bacterium]
MSTLGVIPLIQAAVLEPFILAARTMGTPLEHMLHSVRLPARMLDDPGILVPEQPAWHFVQEITRKEGEPLFGLQAAFELAHQDIKSLKHLLQGCANLKCLLKRFCLVVPTQTNSACYVVEEDGEVVWMIQKGTRLTNIHEQIELFEVAGMMRLVQLAAGENWRPPEIHFRSRHCRHINNAESLNPSRILFSQEYPAIAIPRKLLPLEVPELRKKDDLGNRPYVSSPPDTIKEQIQMAVYPYLGEEKLDNQLLSDICGMSFRSLQRKLTQCDTSYSEVLDQARLRKAQFLLKETEKKMVDISLALGYKNASSFSRTFKRWAGVSPKEYRKLFQPGLGMNHLCIDRAPANDARSRVA